MEIYMTTDKTVQTVRVILSLERYVDQQVQALRDEFIAANKELELKMNNLKALANIE